MPLLIQREGLDAHCHILEKDEHIYISYDKLITFIKNYTNNLITDKQCKYVIDKWNKYRPTLVQENKGVVTIGKRKLLHPDENKIIDTMIQEEMELLEEVPQKVTTTEEVIDITQSIIARYEEVSGLK